MKDAKSYLLKILKIVNPEDDSEAVADMFVGLIYEQALYDLIQTLPKNRRDSVAKKLNANLQNSAAILSLLKHNFTEKQITESTENAAHKAIVEYLQSIEATLNKEQKEQLLKLAQENKSVN